MTHVETNDLYPTAAQAKRDTREQYRDQILSPLEAAENLLFAIAYRLRERPYDDDTHADRAHNLADYVSDLRIDLGGEE